jgi:hypothetical protein
MAFNETLTLEYEPLGLAVAWYGEMQLYVLSLM